MTKCLYVQKGPGKSEEKEKKKKKKVIDQQIFCDWQDNLKL